MKKTAFLILIVCILSCDKFKTREKIEDTNFEDSYKISSNLDRKANLLIINIKLKKNFHAYTQGEKIGKPLSLEINGVNGYEALGEALIPAGTIKKLASSGQSHVIEGEFSIKQHLKMGSGPGKAILRMQICTAVLCDRPRTHEISF